jgi:hypothetical protein
MNDGCLVTESYTVFVFSTTCPCAHWLKIVYDQVVVVYRQTPDFFVQSFQVAFSVSGHYINAAFFFENKTESFEAIFYGVGQIHIRLGSTDEQIQFSFFLKYGDDFPGPAEMAVARALYGI